MKTRKGSHWRMTWALFYYTQEKYSFDSFH